MRDHRKLRAFQLADELVMSVYKGTMGFPKTEQFGLTNQMRRAAVSIASNLVEGSARSSEAEYIRFIEIAYGSACELAYQLSVARRLGFCDEADSSMESAAEETAKVIGGLLKSLRRPSSS